MAGEVLRGAAFGTLVLMLPMLWSLADGFLVCPPHLCGTGVPAQRHFIGRALVCPRRERVVMSTTQKGGGEGSGKGKLSKLEEEKQALLARMAALEIELKRELELKKESDAEKGGELEVAEEMNLNDEAYNKNSKREDVDPLHRPVFEKLMEERGNTRVFEVTELNMTAWHTEQTLLKQGEGKITDPKKISEIAKEVSKEFSKEFSQVEEQEMEDGEEEVKAKRKKWEEVKKEQRLGSYEGRLGIRHFKYRTRDGDLFVKMMVVDAPDVDFSDKKRDEDAQLRELLQLSGLAFPSGGTAGRGLDFGSVDIGEGDDVDFENFDPNLMASMMGSGLGAGGHSGGGGLILDVGPISESLGLKLTGSTKEPKVPFPLDMFEGEKRSLEAIEETKSIRVPSPVASGDLRTEEYAKAMIRAKSKDVVMPAGAFLVTEFLDLTTNGAKGPTPLLVGSVGEKIAQMHQRSEGFSCRYGFDVDTYVGLERQDNKYRDDFLDFFISNRLEPQIKRAGREFKKKWGKNMKERQICDEIEQLSWAAVERLSDSYVWNELIFTPAAEEGPRLLHGDLWVGNMGMDGDNRAVVLNPASWYGPAEFDLSVGETFGMPARFFEAYHHHIPRLEDYHMRLKAYKLHHLLVRLNQCNNATDTTKRPTRAKYKPDNFIGGRTLTTFKTKAVLNPIKHQYRSEMEMLSRGFSEPTSQYLRDCVDLLREIIQESPPKLGQVFKLWGSSAKSKTVPKKSAGQKKPYIRKQLRVDDAPER